MFYTCLGLSTGEITNNKQQDRLPYTKCSNKDEISAEDFYNHSTNLWIGRFKYIRSFSDFMNFILAPPKSLSMQQRK